MEKVILFARVSGIKQNVEPQWIDLVEFAKSNEPGIEAGQVEIIQKQYKVSATNKEYGLVMNDLINLIEQEKIKCLYSTEFTRIARIPYLLETLKNTLVKRKTQFITKQENFVMFDERGVFTTSAKIMFDIHKTMVEEEIERKNERVARGIKDAAEKNKWLGGKVVLFGYMVDENNHYQIDPDKSKIVQDIFNLYIGGNHSFKTIEDIILRKHNISLNRLKIGKILHNKYYTGEKILKAGYKFERQYPKLVDIEDYNKCQTLLNQRSGRIQDKSKGIYYASRLIVCSCCGSKLVPFNKQNSYKCKKYVEAKTCIKGDSINIELIDSLALKVAMLIDAVEKQNITKEKILGYNTKIEELQEKINSSEKQLNAVREKRLIKYSKEFKRLDQKRLMELAEESLIEDKIKIENENVTDKNEIERLKNLINRTENDKLALWGLEYLKTGIPYIVPDNSSIHKERYNIVHQWIKEIRVPNIDKFIKDITIMTHDDNPYKFRYHNKERDNNKRLFEYKYPPYINAGEFEPIPYKNIVIKRSDLNKSS